jgi:peptidoglycan/LPS O-acetylase OafA/YrhL
MALVVIPMFPHPKLAKWGHVHGIQQVWYWLFLSNWSIALGGSGVRHGMIDLSWTLSIEEQFYLAWPVMVRMLDRRHLMAACLGLIVLGPVVRLALTLAGAPPIWASMMTPARVDTLAIGAWIALASRSGKGLAGMISGARWMAVAAAAGVAALYLPHDHSGLRIVLGPTALGCFYGAVLVLAVGNRPRGLVAWAASNRLLIVFGLYSYALYLFHNPIQALIRDTVYGPSRFPTLMGSALAGQLIFCVAATAPALALAWLSWHCFEGPTLGLKRFFPSGRGPAARGPRECRPLELDPTGIEEASVRETC